MSMDGLLSNNHQLSKQRLSPQKSLGNASHLNNKQNQVGTVMLYGIPIVSLVIESQERLCLAQISNTLLKQYSYNEIHNRRVALGITCVQCTPVQLEILRRAGAMPVSSRRCGMITRREAERLCKSFLGDNAPPRLPDDFAFSVHHECAWGCRGAFLPSRYNSSRAKCIKCTFCGLFFSPNKFIFHSHRTSPNAAYVQPDAANFNSWRRHMKLSGSPPDDVVHAWEDVKAMFNGGTRKRLLASSSSSSGSSSLPVRSSMAAAAPITMTSTPTKQIKLDSSTSTNSSYSTPANTPMTPPTPSRVPPFPDLALPITMMDYVWQNGVNAEGIKHQFPFAPYAVPWFGNAKRSVLGLSSLSSVTPQQESILQHLCPPSSEKLYHHSAFRPVFPTFGRPDVLISPVVQNNIVKRQITSEEFLLPKKKYSREVEKFENSRSGELSESDSNQNVIESVDKENELRKSDTRDSYPEIIESDSLPALKMTLKKELLNETSNDSDDMPKPLAKVPEGKELIDVTRLLSIKPNLLEESVFKFREFSPNLLEAISNLKTEDREVYGGLAVKFYQEGCGGLNDKRIPGVYRKQEIEDDEDSRQSSRSENCDDDDEPVDVETTDDFPARESSHGKTEENYAINVQEKRQREQEVRGKPEGENANRIWTIARFSLEEPDSNSPTPQHSGFRCANDHENPYETRKGEELKENFVDHKSQKAKSECLSCCQVAFGNG